MTAGRALRRREAVAGAKGTGAGWPAARYLLLLLALAAFVHAPYLGGGWLTDDFVHLAHLSQEGPGAVLSTPDAFGFYRPVAHGSLLLDRALFGPSPAAWRATNLLLHLGVIGASFVLARLLLETGRAALFATLAFVLTAKPHPQTVLWISARGEILMALFSLLCAACWISWERGRGLRWLAASFAGYVLAFLSKETAVLLPLLLLVTPPDPIRPSRRRLRGATLFIAAGAALMGVRARVGALLPGVDHEHYNLVVPAQRWLRNFRNYLGRAVPSPAALLLTVAAAAAADVRRLTLSSPQRRTALRLLAFAAFWFLTFMMPVLPIVGRSEIYLYVAVFGLCVLAGHLADAASRTTRRAILAGGLGIYVAVLGAFQVSRAAAIHDDLVFSARLADALAGDAAVSGHRGVLLLVPEDDATERYLRDSVGGYLDIAIKGILGRTSIGAWVAYAGEPERPATLRIGCAYTADRVVLRPLPPE